MNIGNLQIPGHEFSTKLPDIPPPDPRAMQIAAMFLQLDERGKLTILALAASQAKLCSKT